MPIPVGTPFSVELREETRRARPSCARLRDRPHRRSRTGARRQREARGPRLHRHHLRGRLRGRRQLPDDQPLGAVDDRHRTDPPDLRLGADRAVSRPVRPQLPRRVRALRPRSTGSRSCRSSSTRRTSMPGGSSTGPPARRGRTHRSRPTHRCWCGATGPNGTLWAERPDVPRLPIRSWQIWNEPNLRQYWCDKPNAKQYVAMLRAVGTAIKQVDRSAHIVTAGLPDSKLSGAIPLKRFIDQMYAAKAAKYFDSLAINSYAKDHRAARPHARIGPQADERPPRSRRPDLDHRDRLGRPRAEAPLRRRREGPGHANREVARADPQAAEQAAAARGRLLLLARRRAVRARTSTTCGASTPACSTSTGTRSRGSTPSGGSCTRSARRAVIVARCGRCARLALALLATALVVLVSAAPADAKVPPGFVGVTAEDVFAGDDNYRTGEPERHGRDRNPDDPPDLRLEHDRTAPRASTTSRTTTRTWPRRRRTGIRILPVLFNPPRVPPAARAAAPPARRGEWRPSRASRRRSCAATGRTGTLWSEAPRGAEEPDHAPTRSGTSPTSGIYWCNRRPNAQALRARCCGRSGGRSRAWTAGRRSSPRASRPAS